MKVFISYGSGNDQVTALRLQALGAVNGLTVFVPPAYTRDGLQPLLDPATAQKLNDADVVLGVVGIGLSEACRQELNMGLALNKTMIVMSSPALAENFRPFGSNLVVIDPSNPGAAETAIVGHLKGLNNTQQSAKTALLALGTLALGLSILASASRD